MSAQTSYPNPPSAIVSPHFLAPYPVDLTIVRKLMSLSDGNFAVTDVNGNVMFKVKAKHFSLRDRRVLLDANGVPVLSFQKKVLTVHNRWVVYRGDSSDSKDIIFSAKQSSLIQFKTSLDVFLGSNEKESVCDYKVKGSWFDRSCTIYAGAQRGDASMAYSYLKSFEFVFVLHMMKGIMQKTDALCQGLQKKAQDIINAVDLVSATKVSLNNFRNNGWDSLIKEVIFFCQRHEIEMPDMSAPYRSTRYRPRKTDLHVTFEHFYRVDLFMETLDKQIHELDSRFSEQSMELLSLGSTLCLKEINIDHIVLLVEKYYPTDFTEQERHQLRCQLETFQVERINNAKLSEVATLSDLCQTLVETGKNIMYDLVERVCRLLLTLPVSTATTERGFSAMKIFKNRLRNKMSDDNLANSLVVYIEKEIADKFDSESIIEEFKGLKGRKAEL